MTIEAPWLELNRAMWDGKVPLHMKAPLYDVDGFKQGRLSLKLHEVRDLAELAGKRLIHLQCHIGLDTLSWARLGACVTGLDFSPPAVAAARELAGEIGADARFVCSDVYDAPLSLRGETFDIVYTGVGALCWLPDMVRWAAVVRDLLRPGGRLYLFEFHPIEWVLEGVGDETLLRHDYFTGEAGYTDGGSVDYADAGGAQSNTVQWNHTLGEVVTAVAGAGLRINSLKELDRSVLPKFPGMRPTDAGMYRMPETMPSLPLMYVLQATRPTE